MEKFTSLGDGDIHLFLISHRATLGLKVIYVQLDMGVSEQVHQVLIGK